MFFFLVSGGLVQSCGHIIPESPVLAMGSNFTALCILNESCLDFGNIYASQIIWKMKNKVVPKEQYREINITVSSVTFNDTSSLASPLTCNVLADGQIEQNIYGISVTVGCKYWVCFFLFSLILVSIVAPKKIASVEKGIRMKNVFTFVFISSPSPSG